MAIFSFFFMTWQRKNGLDISCSCKNRPTSRWWRNLVLSLLFQDDCFSKRKRNLFLGHKGKYNQQFLCSSVRSSFNNFLFFHNSDGKTSHILFLKDGSHRVTALLFLTWQDQLLSPLKAMINLPYDKTFSSFFVTKLKETLHSLQSTRKIDFNKSLCRAEKRVCIKYTQAYISQR